jgi:hypothetical protein
VTRERRSSAASPAAADAILGAVVIGVDPGRHVGLAWVDADGALLRGEVVEEAELARLDVGEGVAIALGSGTGSRAARSRLEAAGRIVTLVDDRATTEEGRRLYWRDHPPRGWRRCIPVGFRPPPAGVDAYAAYAIALRWLALTRDPPTAPSTQE